MSRFCLLSLISLAALSLACGCEPQTHENAKEAAQWPLQRLSDYGFFKGPLRDFQANRRVRAYSLNSPLFSDYTQKRRFVYLPAGSSIQYRAAGSFEFPDGAVIIKTFSMLKDRREPKLGERFLETRLLIKSQGQWQAYPYLWNDEQTEANLEIVGAELTLAWIDKAGQSRRSDYLVPNSNDCKSCHKQKHGMDVIGPKAKHLNGPYKDSLGVKAKGNQLDEWSQAGWLKGWPGAAKAPRNAVWNDPATGSLEQRARAYLDINCAHCHNPEGHGNNSGLDLRREQSDARKYGVMKAPVAAGRGSGGLSYDIVPGKPEQSILFHRMNSTEADVAMPEFGRAVLHREGLELVRAWIQSMKP